MHATVNPFSRPALLIALMSAGLSSVNAAERVVLEKQVYQGAIASTVSVSDFVNLNAHELSAEKTQTYASGRTVTRHVQLFQGIPIWGESIIEHRDPGANLPRVIGVKLSNLQRDLPSVKPLLSKKDVLMRAKTLAQVFDSEDDQAKLYIRQDKDGVARLVYVVSFLATNTAEPTRPFYLLDANTGAVIDQWSGIHRANSTGPGGNAKTGQYEYGTDRDYLNVTKITNNTCALDNANVSTINMDNGTTATEPFTYTCTRNTSRPINGAFTPMNDAHYFAGVVFAMYKSWFGIRPIPKKLVMKVHYKQNYENSFWDGKSIAIGDGAATLYPLVSLDISAHEISHGFTEQNSALMYTGQPGAINEAFSDMAGEAAEYFSKGNNDWQVGREIVKGAGALRFMDDPTRDGNSIGHVSNYSDEMDVHYSSGIYNKAFYLLANTRGWNTRKAFEVMTDANRLYWNTDSTFNQAACGVLNAASNREYPVQDVVAAFRKVGVTCTPR